MDTYSAMSEQVFSDWLESNGGMPAFRMNRKDIATQDMRQRVQYGKQAESGIISALRSAGWDILPASDSQDMLGKIDGWVRLSDMTIPLQVKYRDSQDDILMEVMKDWKPENFAPGAPITFNGRDMMGGAKLYASMNKAGTVIRVRSADEAKQVAESMGRRLKDLYRKTNGNISSLQTPKGEIKITRDPATGIGKVMAFIKPEALTRKIPAALMHQGSMDIPVAGGSMWAVA